MNSDRYKNGLETLEKTTGAAGTAVIEKLNEIHPDLGKFTIEFPYGDIISRPQLDLKTRQIANVAALTALGHALPQLKVHVQGALNVGWTEDEIKEVILQMAIYAGFPAMLNAMFAAQEVFQENSRDTPSGAELHSLQNGVFSFNLRDLGQFIYSSIVFNLLRLL